MPKLKRVSGEEAIHVLEKLGFVRVRQAEVSPEEFMSQM
jgi:predicted RNA binding protein YcfA (HicA-like mRNA interferase family)